MRLVLLYSFGLVQIEVKKKFKKWISPLLLIEETNFQVNIKKSELFVSTKSKKVNTNLYKL